MTSGVQNDKIIHKTKSVKRKKLPSGGLSEAGNGVSSSPERAEKKKAAVSGAVKGHKIKSEKFSDVEHATERRENTDCTVHKNESPTQQTTSPLKQSVNGCMEKKRKRKKKGEKKPDLNDDASMQDADEHSSKKLRTDSVSESGKTVVSSSNVQPGAFENYRITPTMADKLRGRHR